jgi:hypothetical protein
VARLVFLGWRLLENGQRRGLGRKGKKGLCQVFRSSGVCLAKQAVKEKRDLGTGTALACWGEVKQRVRILQPQTSLSLERLKTGDKDAKEPQVASNRINHNEPPRSG